MTTLEAPQGTRTIRSHHAHIYFRDADERVLALELREWIGQRFVVQLGRIHDAEIGPHGAPMYQVAFSPDVFAPFVNFLMLNRRGLSVLVHPNTGRALDDHLVNSLWLGTPLPIRTDFLTNDPTSDVISPIEPNTTPSLSGD